MVTIKVKGGSQERIRCRWLADDPVVSFPVSECSSYDDKRLPSVRDLEKIAWILLTKKTGRHIGFVTAKQFHQIGGEDAEIVPAASACTSNKGE
jgi:hypothetical protein